MQNLEQIRAKNALAAADSAAFKGKEGGEIVKKVPTMIMENGLLGAAAFAIETGKGYEKVFRAIIIHLLSLKRTKADSVESFVAELVNADSTTLRAVTSESIAYLSYLRRFAKKNKEA